MNKDVRAYLVHSYLYYVLNTSVISDTEYDMLCKKLLDSNVEHPLISKEDLAAGTGFSIVDYPPDIVAEADELANSIIPGKPAISDEKPLEFKFNGNPTETYLLLGMYIDYGLARQRDAQKILKVELQRRWSEGIHKSEFLSYFKDHRVNPERFGLS